MLSVADKLDFATTPPTGSWYRLIPSRFPTIDIYRRVAAPEKWPLAAEIETMTNPRVRLRDKFGRGLEKTNPNKFQNWNHAPFAYPNPGGTWLFGSHVNALELADTVQTALAVAIRKREQFLAATDAPPLDLEMRVLKHEVNGQAFDLRNTDLDLPRDARWSIGDSLLDKGGHAALYVCPVRSTGTIASVFDQDALGSAMQTQHFKFRWDGARISQLYDFRSESDGAPITAEMVFDPQTVPFLNQI